MKRSDFLKVIVRHVTKHEAEQGKHNWFKTDARANLRRLNDLGVSGHQPAIKAYCQMTKQEKAQIVEAILKQKNANSKKTETIYNEHRERQKQAETSEDAMKAFASQGNKILLRIARIAIRATAKWDRKFRELNEDEI